MILINEKMKTRKILTLVMVLLSASALAHGAADVYVDNENNAAIKEVDTEYDDAMKDIDVLLALDLVDGLGIINGHITHGDLGPGDTGSFYMDVEGDKAEAVGSFDIDPSSLDDFQEIGGYLKWLEDSKDSVAEGNLTLKIEKDYPGEATISSITVKGEFNTTGTTMSTSGTLTVRGKAVEEVPINEIKIKITETGDEKIETKIDIHLDVPNTWESKSLIEMMEEAKTSPDMMEMMISQQIGMVGIAASDVSVDNVAVTDEYGMMDVSITIDGLRQSIRTLATYELANMGSMGYMGGDSAMDTKKMLDNLDLMLELRVDEFEISMEREGDRLTADWNMKFLNTDKAAIGYLGLYIEMMGTYEDVFDYSDYGYDEMVVEPVEIGDYLFIIAPYGVDVGEDIELEVTDIYDGGVEGVNVIAVMPDGNVNEYVTDDNGAVIIPALNESGMLLIGAVKDGYSPDTGWVDVGYVDYGNLSGLEVIVPWEVSKWDAVEVRILDADRNPVFNASVVALSAEGGYETYMTDDNGAVKFVVTQSGTIYLLAAKKGYSPGEESISIDSYEPVPPARPEPAMASFGGFMKVYFRMLEGMMEDRKRLIEIMAETDLSTRTEFDLDYKENSGGYDLGASFTYAAVKNYPEYYQRAKDEELLQYDSGRAYLSVETEDGRLKGEGYTEVVLSPGYSARMNDRLMDAAADGEKEMSDMLKDLEFHDAKFALTVKNGHIDMKGYFDTSDLSRITNYMLKGIYPGFEGSLTDLEVSASGADEYTTEMNIYCKDFMAGKSGDEIKELDIVGYGAEVHMGASSSDTTPKSVEKPAVDMPGELKKVKQDSINEIEKLRGAGGAGIDRTLILIIAAAVIGVAIICLLFLKRTK